jgi:hypothetical protein
LPTVQGVDDLPGTCQVLVPRVHVDPVWALGAGVTVAEVYWVKKYFCFEFYKVFAKVQEIWRHWTQNYRVESKPVATSLSRLHRGQGPSTEKSYITRLGEIRKSTKTIAVEGNGAEKQELKCKLKIRTKLRRASSLLLFLAVGLVDVGLVRVDDLLALKLLGSSHVALVMVLAVKRLLGLW